MAVSLNVSAVQPFDAHGDANSLCQRWERWIRSFELYVGASGVQDDNQKRQLLLHCAGEGVQDIFYTLSETGTTYETAKAKVTDYFTPRKNTSYNRHMFRKAVQSDGESVGQFVTRLRQLASLCEFGDQIHDFIRDQVIDNCKSKRLRTKLLAERDLKLERVLDLAAAMEASERQAAQMSEGGERSYMIVEPRRGNRPKLHMQQKETRRPPVHSDNRSQQQNCTKCGRRGHAAESCRCTANAKCFKCGRIGHFSKVCRNNNAQSRAPQRHESRTQKHAVRHVSESASGSEGEYEDEYTFSTARGETVEVTIGGVKTTMIIDSGSTCNIINSTCKEQLVQQGVRLIQCRRKIHPYSSPPINVRQSVKADITLDDGRTARSEFLIVEGEATPLLGKATSESLGLLQIGVNRAISSDDYGQKVIDQFPKLWTGIGRLKGVQVKLHIDKSVPPVAVRHNRVPFHQQQKVAKEINKLEAADIIEKVSGPTEWVSRIVTPPKPKKPDEIRLCVDMRAANKAILRTRHVTPTLDELITQFNGATIFSKIDLRSGYHQLVLHPSSRYITTFSTHVGLYQYKRLSFGINAAAEVFQHEIQTVIQGVSGAINISDDIAIFGVDKASHDEALKSVLERLQNAGLTANLEKCEFAKKKIEFFGLVFSSEGVSPDPKKVADLHAANEPQNPSEVRSFLGMAQYSARFIENFATITEPLRYLTKQTSEWRWGAKEAASFQKVKASLEESATNAYFDMKKDIEIVVDASPVGLAALLVQEERVVTYASRALTGVEARYSQTEREALAVVWACEHFNRFIKGAPRFTVISDHKPLESIWQKARPPLRIERWGLRLQPYNMIVKYRPGTSNPADYMSRHPARLNIKRSREQQMAEHYVNALASVATPMAMSVEEVKRETAKDETLQAVIKLIQKNKWHDVTQYGGLGVDYDSLCSFNRVKDVLTVNESSDLVMKDYQIVIPTNLQKRVVELAHDGHQGMSKTKALLRSKVWFPGVDVAVEEAVRSCIPCQANSTRRDTQPLTMSALPRGPWLEISIDFCGPLPTGEYLLVMVDEFSRFPVVEVVRSTSAETVIPVVDGVFSLLGYPEVVKSDNGPPFSGHVWQSYMQENNVRHRKITPLWPQANAQAEAFNKPLMKALKSANISGKAWRKEMRQFLRAYRCTPHVTTAFTPHRLLFARDPRTKLPEVKRHHSAEEKIVRQNDAVAKLRMKAQAEKRVRVESTIGKGDIVLVRQRRTNKLSTPFDPRPLVVVERKASMLTARRSCGSKVTRNVSMFRHLPYASKRDLPPVEEDTDSEMETAAPDTAPVVPLNDEPTQQRPVETAGPRRSSRVSKPPGRLVEQM